MKYSTLQESSYKQDLQKSTYSSFNYTKRESTLNHSQISTVEPSLVFLLRDVFKDILMVEGLLEATRQELKSRPDFTLPGVFNTFSGYSQARIGPQDLQSGLERLGVICDLKEVQMIIDRYDSDRDGKISFWEFSNALLPIDSLSRDDVERRKPQWELSFETKELLRRVFRKIVDGEILIENLRKRIKANEKSINLRKAFENLDWLNRGYITANEFKRIFDWHSQTQESSNQLKESRYVVQDQYEVEGMIRRFNKDKLNGRVLLNEFIEELTPKI